MAPKLLGVATSGATDGATKSYVDGMASSGDWRPEDHALIGWAYDPVIASTGSVLTSGTVQLIGIQVRNSASAVSVLWHNNSAASGLTSGQNFAGLYNSAGTRLATVAIAGTTLAIGLQTNTFTSQALTPGLYWIALLFVGTTLPQPIRLATYSSATINVGVTASTARYATGPTAQTSLPASITPASNVLTAIAYWGAIK